MLVFVVDLAMIPDSYLQVWSCQSLTPVMFNTLCEIFVPVKLQLLHSSLYSKVVKVLCCIYSCTTLLMPCIYIISYLLTYLKLLLIQLMASIK